MGQVSLDPIRARLLAELAEPGSASTLADQTGLSRQKANYHLRALERHGLVELVEERRKGNCIERVLRATAASYVISPTALSAVAPSRVPTSCPYFLGAISAARFSYLIEPSSRVCPSNVSYEVRW